jgi:hypothetical protein
MLIGDRRRDSDRQLLYCGSMVVRDLAGENRPVHVIKRDTQLEILLGNLTNAQSNIPGYRIVRPQPGALLSPMIGDCE